MNKRSLVNGLLFFTLLINVTVMHAQDDKKLDARQRCIVSISASTAVGDLEQLKRELATGLHSGLTVNEIKELLVHLYAYCGFPRSLNGITTFMAVLEERKAQGFTDVQGEEAKVAGNAAGKYEKGRKVLEALTKTPQAKPAPGFGAFAPRIDAFLKEHLFADVFESQVLTYQQRELATISALTAMPGVEPQLRSHISTGMNTGITEGQLVQVAEIIERNVSKTRANALRGLLSKPKVPVIEPDMMVRLSEIEIFPDSLEAYKSILKEEAAASVKIEPGVIAIFPMYQQEAPAQIRIVEIYGDSAAYRWHLKTPHFQHYKVSTAKMVKSLKLVDMKGIDAEAMLEIFKKLK